MDNRVFQAGAKVTPPAAPAAPSNGYPTNGDPVGNIPATQPGDFWFHQIGEELRAIVVAAGLAPSTANTAQVLEAIQRLIDAQSGNYALDTGAANAYVVALNPTIAAYTEGLSIRVKAINANTGASTLDAGGGVVALVNDIGGALANGDIPAGVVLSVVFVATNNHFRILSQVQSQDDARYAGIAQVHYVGTTAIPANRASAAQTLNGVSIDGTAQNQSGGTVAATTGSFSGLISANGGQIKFPATQNSSSDPNTLDDYEEGTWTPYVGGTATYNPSPAIYVKIGRSVTISFALSVIAIGTGSTYQISGLPFSSIASTPLASGPLFFSNAGVAVTSLIGVIYSSSNLVTTVGLTAASVSVSTITAIASGTNISGSITYQI